MDFFASQDRARASTRRLLFLYVCALLGVVISLNVIAALIFSASHRRSHDEFNPDNVNGIQTFFATSNLGVYATTTLSILTLVALATMFKQLQIGGDGAKVAELLGGREITTTPDDLDERKFMNVVEEMSLASGVARPRLFVMDHEEGINAFAAGTRPESAVVSVTRGALTKLNRDELQGVVAHEFSHILNGDMRLNLRLIALNFGIMAIGYIGLQILRFAPYDNRRSSRKNDNGGAAILLFAVAMMIIGYVGTLFGKMLQAAVSRQREYLADASAVQFTRNPNGIANALKKIGGYRDGSVLATPHAGEASHMFFSDGVVGFLDSIFATHPPLPDRIRAIDPSFNDVLSPADEGAVASSPSSPLTAGFAARPVLPRAGQTMAARPADLRAARSVIRPGEISFAAATLDALPDALLAAARDPYSARALALALLLDRDEHLRASQLELIASADPAAANIAATLWPTVEASGPAARLPLLDLAMPALRQMSPTQRAQFRTLCQKCADADGQMSPFELAVLRILDSQVHDAAARPSAAYRSVSAVRDAAAVVLSALANAGGESQADAAFAAGVAELNIDAPPSRIAGYDPQRLAAALDLLRAATPAVQQRVVNAAAHCVAADRVVRIEEIELMRALCAAFAVPIPPFLQPA